MESLAWTVAAALMAAMVALTAVEIVYLLVRRLGRRSLVLSRLADHTQRAFRFASIALAVERTVAYLTRDAADEAWRQALMHVLVFSVIGATAWLVATLPVAAEDVALERLRADVPDNRQIRRMRTQIVVLRRVVVAVVCVVTLGVLLMTFPSVRAVGTSVLVSAGVIGAITAIAAQSVLGNVLAGIQLVLSDAVRIDDVVVVEGEWGRVEALTLSYVSVQIWDDRRLILPTSYFTTKPFQTWTRTHAALLGTVEFDVDWSVPVQMMREELRRLVESSKLWDGRVCVLQVTEATRGLVRLRALVSADDAGRLWDLRCHVREQLIVWLRTYEPTALPRLRTDMAESPSALHEARGAPSRSGDAAWAHTRATRRDVDRARVFGGSLDGDERGTAFIGRHEPANRQRE